MRALSLFLICLFASPALAEPLPYMLDSEASVVGFTYDISDTPATGTMPVRDAEIILDLARPERSEVTAILDPSRARAGFILATEAMKGPGVLDTGRFPDITFRSTDVRPAPGFRAEIDGEITIRDVTQPVTLEAQIFRQRGTDEGDDRRLTIHLKGSVSRAAFGAAGFQNIVGDTVTLDIVARIARQP